MHSYVFVGGEFVGNGFKIAPDRCGAPLPARGAGLRGEHSNSWLTWAVSVCVYIGWPRRI